MTSASLFESQMAMYTTYHRDPRNRLTHFFGIPAIVLSLLILLALVRFPLAGFELSLAFVIGLAVLLLWIALDLAIGAAMSLFLVPAWALSEWLAATASSGAIWSLFGVLFVGGWILQLWGHVYEGRRPALVSNLFQALIGPMFLAAEVFFALGLKRDLKRRIEEVIELRYADFAETGRHSADSPQSQ